MAQGKAAGRKPPRYVVVGAVRARDEDKGFAAMHPIAQALRQAQDTFVTCAVAQYCRDCRAVRLLLKTRILNH